MSASTGESMDSTYRLPIQRGLHREDLVPIEDNHILCASTDLDMSQQAASIDFALLRWWWTLVR